uniref:Uncharacterized protein n=1 Tax=Molossus molossus TaxID=27622 RepID=A0A7J8HCR2_MOLMO|nr:hypothetical protein HJG59_011111 [Molossus molossus]
MFLIWKISWEPPSINSHFNSNGNDQQKRQTGKSCQAVTGVWKQPTCLDMQGLRKKHLAREGVCPTSEKGSNRNSRRRTETQPAVHTALCSRHLALQRLHFTLHMIPITGQKSCLQQLLQLQFSYLGPPYIFNWLS